jgi:hypothetical protein
VKLCMNLMTNSLKVNESKTEVCQFHRLNLPLIKGKLFGTELSSKYTMNVLGIIFDSKLQWPEQVSNAILKANHALFAIKLIKNYFTQQELCTLLTSNFYSLLYYNSEIWHIPLMNPLSKNHLLAASARALNLCNCFNTPTLSYINLHITNQRATPNQLIKYKHAILLFKLYNRSEQSSDWIDLNLMQSRQLTFKISSTSNFKIGNNILSNRLSCIGLIIDTFKINCKEKFLWNPLLCFNNYFLY